MAAKKPGTWKVLQPFAYQEGDRTIQVERGDAVPATVLEQSALRGRLMRGKFIMDTEHPETFGGVGMADHKAERLARDVAQSLQPKEQDHPVPEEVLAQRRQEAEDRAWRANHRPSVWQPTKSGPDPSNPQGAYPSARLGG